MEKDKDNRENLIYDIVKESLETERETFYSDRAVYLEEYEFNDGEAERADKIMVEIPTETIDKLSNSIFKIVERFDNDKAVEYISENERISRLIKMGFDNLLLNKIRKQ